MKAAIRRISVGAALVGGILSLGAGPAFGDGNGAVTVPCSDFFDGVQGTIVINSQGMLINCFQHTHGDGSPADGSTAQVIDCTDALGISGKGVQVITPTGSVLTNCHPHFI